MSITLNASTSSGFVQSADNSGEIELQSNGTTALKVNTNEGIQILNCLGVGNATPSTSGAGITFPATQSASTDANTLDDYEEGTWTPSVGGSATYSVQLGSYVKVGRVVTATFDMTINSIGSGATATVFGLPFPAGGTAPGQAGSVSYWSGALNGAAWLSIRVDLTATSLAVGGSAATNTTTAAATIVIFTNGTRLIGTITYITSA